MGLINLTLLQFLAILGPVAAGLVALYFYDRSRRRVTVSTLRFLPRRSAPPVTRRHKKIQQPLSLLLQLLAVLLLLLAIGDLRFGLGGDEERRHVILLDASSVMARSSAGQSWMDVARARARQYLRGLPPGDRILLVRADGLPTPATGFTAERDLLAEAIRDTAAGWTALDLDAALAFARDALRLELGVDDAAALRADARLGEVVYIGPGRVAASSGAGASFPRLRWIAVGDDVADSAITRLAAQREPEAPGRWDVTVEVAAESAAGGAPTPAQLVEFFFEDRKLGEREIPLAPDGAGRLEFRIRTERAGALEARLAADDANPRNDAARVELPAAVRLTLAVATDRRARLEPLLGATPNLDVRFVESAADVPGLQLIDRGFSGSPDRAAVYFDPAPETSPVPIAGETRDIETVQWSPGHPVAAGLRETDVRLARASVFEPGPGDEVIASAADGPIAVAGERNGRRFVALGFDPLTGSPANRLTTPLLFANAVRWFAPEVFRLAEYRAESPGSVRWEVGPVERAEVAVQAVEGDDPVWVWDEGEVRLFSRVPGTYLLRTPFQQTRLTMSLPETAPERRTPPDGALQGVPPPWSGVSGVSAAWWPWLALAALALLASDWRLFGRRPGAVASSAAAAPAAEPLRPGRRAA